MALAVSLDISVNSYKYNPNDFDEPLRDSMTRVYSLLENKGDELEIHYAITDVYFDVKEAVKFKEINPVLGEDIQHYFEGMTTW